MGRAFLGLGSNEGDRFENISKAVQGLNDTSVIRVTNIAPIIETEPVGGPPQGAFLNTVVEIETALSPRQLLFVLQAIERQLGRVPSKERWAPRPIDLDLLLYNDLVVNEPDLVIPHPRMHERAFVLMPLEQLAPELVHPVLQQSISRLLAVAR